MSEFSEAQKCYMDALFNKITNAFNEKTLLLSNELRSQISNIKLDIKKLSDTYEDKLNELEHQNQQLRENINYLERKTRKNNIVIFGIKNVKDNLWHTVLHLFKNTLEVDVTESDLNNIYTLGNSKNNPVKVEFISFKKKVLVLKNSSKLKGHGIFLHHDLSYNDRAITKVLNRHMKEAKLKGQQAYIKGNKLIIGGDSYTVDQLENKVLDWNTVEEDCNKPVSAPATPNPKKRETLLQKELGLEESVEDQQEDKKKTAAKSSKSNKSNTIKTRSNSVASEKSK